MMLNEELAIQYFIYIFGHSTEINGTHITIVIYWDLIMQFLDTAIS